MSSTTLISAMMVSLAGYVAGPSGELTWSEPSDELHQHFNALYLTGRIDTSIYGRRLYENMASYWPSIQDDSDVSDVEKEFARVWKEVPKWVYSRTLDRAEWATSLVRELVPEEIQRSEERRVGKSGGAVAA